MTIEGNVGFDNSNHGVGASGGFVGEGLSIFLGQGPVTLENGDPNPGAMGVMLSDASIALLKFGTNQYAIEAEGTITLIGLDGLNVSGTAITSLPNASCTTHGRLTSA